MSWSTVAWHHTGRPSWAAAGWNDRMGIFERFSKTHLIGYGDDATKNEYGESATLCGITIPSAHRVYSLPHGYKPGRKHPVCRRCERGARKRGIGDVASHADKEEE